MNQSVATFLDEVASRQPAPGGGAVAGVALAGAAGLAAMAARFCDAGGDRALTALADRADELRERSARLAEADTRAYAAVLDAYRRPRDADAQQHGRRIQTALAEAADVPLAMVDCAREVGELAERVALDGNPNLRGDALTAALLAAAAARSAAHLVRLNVAEGRLDEERVTRAEAGGEAVAAAVRRVEASS